MGRVVKASDLVEKKEVRQDAQTTREFSDAVGVGITAGNKMLAVLLQEGRVKRVYKRVKERLIPAYIPNGNSKKS